MSPALRIVGGIVIAAIVGFMLARSGGGRSPGSSQTALTGHASGMGYTVAYPSGWSKLSGAPAGLQPPLTSAVALKPKTAGRELIIGRSSLTAAAAAGGTLPQSLLSLLATRPVAQRVLLGQLRWYRYEGLAPHGQGVTESVYLLPTTAGTIGAVCVARSGAATFAPGCEQVLASLRLTSGSPVSSSVDVTYATALNTILSRLNSARGTDGPGLRSPSLTTRARAATELAAAHQQAATAAGGLTGTGAASANRALVAALDQVAAGYRALAGAIQSKSVSGYGRAETRLSSADTALTRAYTGLRALGYQIG